MTLLGRKDYGTIGSLLHYIMQHLAEHGLARIYPKHNGYIYVIECKSLDRIERKLRELKQTS
ncbi:MAG: hypothetical protein GXO10_04315 [Crenarchaeota archaeon]|nr:hypothetical protein [Thermoproteota archaeon]